MKIYDVYFKSIWPVPSGLIIAAENKEQARELAKKTIEHTEVGEITEIEVNGPTVLFYESGEY